MSEVETGSCHGFIEWLLIIGVGIILIIIEIIEELPKLITLAVFLFTCLGYILFSCYLLIFSFSTDKRVRTILNYRIDFELMGIHILMPPIWCFYILIGVCLSLWSLSPDLMGLMK